MNTYHVTYGTVKNKLHRGTFRAANDTHAIAKAMKRWHLNWSNVTLEYFFHVTKA
jgi:hypothetical protein